MSDAAVHTVRFEPMGIEMDVQEGETVLDAAFRQGISVMHGCKEGQCASCKSKLVDGDIELLKYSTFALPESERDTDHILLCRTLAFSDITVELLNYDEDLLSRSIAVKEFGATLTFAGSLQGVTRTLPLEIYLQRETDPDAAVALSLVLVVVAVVIVVAVRGRGSAGSL